MAYVKELKVIDMRYGNFAANLLTTILSVGKDAQIINAVFDVYAFNLLKT